MTLAAMLDDAAARAPHAVAIHSSAGSLSYADLADRVARVAHGFMSLGLTGQDRSWSTSSGTAAAACSSRRRHCSVP
jgi:non-ribosomal peptide synthetase component E (peptide arylation enzyme)